MFEKIPAPVKGQPARASWGAGVSSRLNELCSMFPSRGLARDGLTGTGFAPLPENRRNRVPSARLPGRFEVSFTPEEVGEGEEQTYTATFANPYYDIGGKTYELKGEQGTGNGEQGTVSIVGVKSGEIITLKINAGPEQGARLAKYRSIDELQEVQADDVTTYTVPLYAVGAGVVVCDFRTGPISGMGEF